MDTLHNTFQKEIKKQVQDALKIKNPMQVPQLSRIVINMGVRGAVDDKKNMERGILAMTQIAGQKPKVVKAKKSIASFKLREGQEIGLVATMRGKRMYAFFDKLVAIVLPRIRDFHGVRRTSFDGKGNYSLGFIEYTVFPEIDPGKFDKIQGLEIVIVTTAKTNKEGEVLLEKLGMPFVKVQDT